MSKPALPQGGRPGAFLRALRPALLLGSVCGVVPVSGSDGTWRPLSTAALRSALISALLLALGAAAFVSYPKAFFTFGSALQVFAALRFLILPLKWFGMVVWVWSNARRLEAYFKACSQYENNFDPLELRDATRYVRNYVGLMVALTTFYTFHMEEVFSSFPVWFQVALIINMCGMANGTAVWLMIMDGSCLSLADAFRGVSRRLRVALSRNNIPQLRRLVRQHGQLCQLAGVFCRTFGGLLTICIYTMALDLSLDIYLRARSGQREVGVGSAVFVWLERLASLLPLLLLKLTTNAGDRVVRRAQRAAELVRGHTLASSRTDDDPDYAVLLAKLDGQQVHMNMNGYFILDRSLFIQTMKDIMTLIIAVAQFDMTA
ncbi:hypothetical protein FJT64_024912 [Amphibalanus amphitrite]|uniref:Gustatory receptor n=1 Tax=Amphibalanus amphitrite TaxID=1232801 RepID=A0A6A4W987_AMPAM|nr:hypothetical protein FJT64_024912 [Amphibalanus amphitrite]